MIQLGTEHRKTPVVTTNIQPHNHSPEGVLLAGVDAFKPLCIGPVVLFPKAPGARCPVPIKRK